MDHPQVNFDRFFGQSDKADVDGYRGNMSSRLRPPLRRFSQLSTEDINSDLHIHTKQTDGKADIVSILRSASDRGLQSVGFTEHVRRTTEWFSEFARAVHRASLDFPHISVYIGCESKALDQRGSLDVREEILSKCDIVLGSVHRFPDGQGGYIQFGSLTKQEMITAEFNLAMGLLSAAPIDVLAHPGGMFARRHKEDFPVELLKILMARATERGIAIEVNSSYIVRPETFLSLCAEVDPIVSIGSDMHDIEDLGTCRDVILSWRKKNS
jgi:putative hydrolase